MQANRKVQNRKLYLLIITIFIGVFYFDLRTCLIKYRSISAEEHVLQLQFNTEINLIKQRKIIMQQLQKIQKPNLIKSLTKFSNPLDDHENGNN